MAFTLNLDPEELVVGGYGYVATSDLDVDFPDDIADCIPDPESLSVNLAEGWGDLGLLSEAGPRASFAKNTKDINAWQTFYAVRTIVTEVPTQIEMELRQWNSDTFALGVGGADVTSSGSGVILVPKDPSFLDIRQLLVYAADGEKHYAFGFRRVQNTRELQFPFAREDESALPVGFKVLAPPTGEAAAWFMLTDDEAFAVTGS